MKKKIILFVILYILYLPLGIVLGLYLANKIAPAGNGLILALTTGIAVGLPIIIFLSLYNRPSKKQKQLLMTGIEADGLVLSVQDTGISMNNDLSLMIRLKLKVQPRGDAAFEITTDGMFSRVYLPRPGDVVKVKYDPADKSEIVII